MDGDCGYVAAADRVTAPVVRAALHGCCAVIVDGQQGIGCERVRRCGDHHCWRVSDGADVRIGRYGCSFRPIRKLVSSDTRRPRRSAAAWRYPPVLSGRPPASPRYPPASPRYPPASPGCAPDGVGCFRVLRGRWRWGGVGGLDVNGMCSAVRGMGSAMRGMMLVVRGMCLAVRGMGSAACGMCSAACLADWGKQKKQFRRTASYGWQMGLEPTTFRTTI